MTLQADKFLSKAVNALPDASKSAIPEAELDNARLLRAYPRTSPELLGLTWGEQSVEGSADENILASAEYDFSRRFAVHADIPSASIAGSSTDNPVHAQIDFPEFPKVVHSQTMPPTSNTADNSTSAVCHACGRARANPPNTATSTPTPHEGGEPEAPDPKEFDGCSV